MRRFLCLSSLCTTSSGTVPSRRIGAFALLHSMVARRPSSPGGEELPWELCEFTWKDRTLLHDEETGAVYESTAPGIYRPIGSRGEDGEVALVTDDGMDFQTKLNSHLSKSGQSLRTLFDTAGPGADGALDRSGFERFLSALFPASPPSDIHFLILHLDSAFGPESSLPFESFSYLLSEISVMHNQAMAAAPSTRSPKIGGAIRRLREAIRRCPALAEEAFSLHDPAGAGALSGAPLLAFLQRSVEGGDTGPRSPGEQDVRALLAWLRSRDLARSGLVTLEDVRRAVGVTEPVIVKPGCARRRPSKIDPKAAARTPGTVAEGDGDSGGDGGGAMSVSSGSGAERSLTPPQGAATASASAATASTSTSGRGGRPSCVLPHIEGVAIWALRDFLDRNWDRCAGKSTREVRAWAAFAAPPCPCAPPAALEQYCTRYASCLYTEARAAVRALLPRCDAGVLGSDQTSDALRKVRLCGPAPGARQPGGGHRPPRQRQARERQHCGELAHQRSDQHGLSQRRGRAGGWARDGVRLPRVEQQLCVARCGAGGGGAADAAGLGAFGDVCVSGARPLALQLPDTLY